MKFEKQFKLCVICILAFDFSYILNYIKYSKYIKNIFLDSIYGISYQDILEIFIKKIKKLIIRQTPIIANKEQLKTVLCSNNRQLIFLDNVIDNTITCEYCLNLYTVVVVRNDIISESFFANNYKLTKVFIGNSTRVIQSGAFANCISLHYVHLPSTLKEISVGAFENCVSLEQLFIPHTIEKIGPNAFANCIKLKKVVFY